MLIVDKTNAEHYLWGNGCDGWHLVKRDGFSVITERVPAGEKEKRHYHSHARQFFYILAGVAVMEMDGLTHVLQTRQGLEVPPGIAHQFRNESDLDVLFLVIRLCL